MVIKRHTFVKQDRSIRHSHSLPNLGGGGGGGYRMQRALECWNGRSVVKISDESITLTSKAT